MPKKRTEEDISKSDDEAEEIHQAIEEEEDNPSPLSEDEGEDLIDDQEKDYQPNQELDRYEEEGIDDDEISQQPGARRKAEKDLERRDRKLIDEGEQVDEYLDDELSHEIRLQERRKAIYVDDEEEEIDEKRYLDAEGVKGKLPIWIKEDQTIKYIKAKFIKFLNQFRGDDAENNYPIYAAKIRDMCITNKQSIQISYNHLKVALPTIAMWVGLEPSLIFPELNSIAYTIACRHYTAYKTLFPEVFVKIKDLPILDHIRELRYIHLGKLIKIKGVATIRSQVFSQLKKIMYKCVKCGVLKGPFFINAINNTKIGSCVSCQSSGPFQIDKQKTIYRNYQKITVQQSPSEVLPGRIPRSKEVILFGENIDVAKPGDEIEITGIFMNRYECSLNVKQGFPLFSTLIEANCVTKVHESELNINDPSSEEKIIKLSRTPNLDKLIYNSIAPSIYGHQDVKRAITLAMFGGVQKNIQGHRIRGDINLLILGDPGIAKSQFLKSIQKVFHRSVYTTGKGASAVGLTASVKRDFSTNEWKLQAGALVLADKGICLIDQFDKMNQNDRTSIHQAMEQQSISISKAGIVATLNARCSVIAAANPLQGRYNSQLSFSENVDLSDPILSRFDIINVLRDEVDQTIDYDLSTFVINSHIQNHPYAQKYTQLQTKKLVQNVDNSPKIDIEMLRSYIKYAREKCKPQVTDKHKELIKQFFNKLREESKHSGGINVAARHIEGIIRMATAHAKIFLRNEISKDDIDVSMQCMLESFIQTQKHSVSKQIKSKFRNYLFPY